MDLLNLSAVLITLAAIFSYTNYRYIGLPSTIGIMLMSLASSIVVLLVLHGFNLSWADREIHVLVENIDFNKALMQGMLSFLLFAGALHINLEDLRKRKIIISILATVGTLGSTLIIGVTAYYALQAFGVEIPFIYCLLFGAIISPTDPIAVLSILKSLHVPKTLETKIAGESLFNDGVAVVVYLVLLSIATGDAVGVPHIAAVFVQEVIGGAVFGLLIGYIALQMLRTVDNYSLEVLITLALVMGGYALANALHISGPIAMVLAGLLLGNHGRHDAMSEKTRASVDNFWELIDEILNAVLFLLIGIEVIIISFQLGVVLTALVAIPLVLLARWICVGIPVVLLRKKREFSKHAVKIMTWGGIRGGISVALALSLPPSEWRAPILGVTYIVVIFSIVVQGLTIGPVLRRLTAK